MSSGKKKTAQEWIGIAVKCLKEYRVNFTAEESRLRDLGQSARWYFVANTVLNDAGCLSQAGVRKALGTKTHEVRTKWNQILCFLRDAATKEPNAIEKESFYGLLLELASVIEAK